MQLEEIGDVFPKSIGPKMRAGFAVDELRVDAHTVLIALNRAFEYVAHPKLLGDLPGVDSLALEGEGGVARNHETVADTRQFGG